MRHKYWGEVEGFSPPPKRVIHDCAIMALGAVAKLSYPEALDCCAKWGNKTDRRGTSTRLMMDNLKFKLAMFNRGWVVRRVDLKDGGATKRWSSLASFVRSHPRGRFVVTVTGHAVPLIDGVLIDFTPGPRRKIRSAYEFYPVGAEPAKQQSRVTFSGKHPVTLVREAVLRGGWVEGMRVAREIGVTHKIKKWLREGVVPPMV